MKRTAGILMPITSLPGKYGIGCFSEEAYRFVDFLQESGQSWWQMLPIHPTGFGDSPYQSFSTFAGNPYMIDLEALETEGVLTKAECACVFFGEDDAEVDYEAQYNNRYPLLRKAYERSEISKNPDYRQFVAENDWWLSDYALFMALKKHFGGQCWYEWPEDICRRYSYAMDHYRRELYFEIEFHMYLQFKFFEQYWQLKKYANDRGIGMIGDIPIYVAMDSADTWAHPELFQLDEDNRPLAVAGCPPDGFSPTGQLWGNPLYRWEYHRKTGYAWWLSRLWYVFQLYDITRIDHFRGFDAYFSIPYGAASAAEGHWEPGPGIDLFRCAENHLGWHKVIAEDLGYVTDSVRDLVRESGFAGMKVLEFAFDSRDSGAASDYLPHNYPDNCVVYTGTHDNETLKGWLHSIPQKELAGVRAYLSDWYTPQALLHKSLIALAMGSVAALCIIPMQDHLGLDNGSRINTPSTIGHNWCWRMKKEQLTAALRWEIRETTERYGRKR